MNGLNSKVRSSLLTPRLDARDVNFHFTDLNLRLVLSDLFLAGAETTSSMIYWFICYLVKYPLVQQRIQKEIDSVVPKGTLPYYSERNK